MPNYGRREAADVAAQRPHREPHSSNKRGPDGRRTRSRGVSSDRLASPRRTTEWRVNERLDARYQAFGMDCNEQSNDTLSQRDQAAAPGETSRRCCGATARPGFVSARASGHDRRGTRNARKPGISRTIAFGLPPGGQCATARSTVRSSFGLEAWFAWVLLGVVVSEFAEPWQLPVTRNPSAWQAA
jgi:hypothetical protein